MSSVGVVSKEDGVEQTSEPVTAEAVDQVNLPDGFTTENFQDMILSWVEKEGAIPPYYDRFKSWDDMKPFQKRKVIRLWGITPVEMKEEIMDLAKKFQDGSVKRTRSSKKGKKNKLKQASNSAGTTNSVSNSAPDDRQLEKKLRVDAAKFLCTHSNPELKALSETFLGNIVRGVPNVFETAPDLPSSSSDINPILI
mmetsp:Transcript_6207/g.9360  ORF Transcript_6207/g.9360 Transcript_6207/m.9360 type:complete len:196 (+) Transcript_6207:36-623(+)